MKIRLDTDELGWETGNGITVDAECCQFIGMSSRLLLFDDDVLIVTK